MNVDAQSAREDLAFLKALVGQDENFSMRPLGEAYFAGGLIYGGQMLLHAAQALGMLPTSAPFAMLIGLGPTALFIPVITWINMRNRAIRPSGVVGRAVGTVFGTIGLANLILILVVGSVAWREDSIPTWLIYPCSVFVMQGAAWLFAYTMRRRTWFALVAAGWFVCAVAMALSVMALGYYILFAGLGLWLCMALPGWHMMRRSAQAV
jgi:hypothetical protein